ncbi:hypothetical protein ACOMHN_041511 [Nucella lapillus]
METTFCRVVQCFCVAVWVVSSGDSTGTTFRYLLTATCCRIQVSMSCPQGLHFSPALRLCDWPQSVACVLPSAVIQKPSELTWKVLCPSHVDYYEFPDWTDCSRHYICIRGTVSKQQCPDGLFYDFMRWTCAYKQDVTCYTP